MMIAGHTVVVVDDNESLREALDMLLQSVGFKVLAFNSAEAFLAAELPRETCCLILDVRMPGRSGLDLQDELGRAGVRLPIVFMTGHGDVPMTVRAMKGGAVDFLPKPFREQELLDAVQRAIAAHTAQRQEAASAEVLTRRYEALTPREREILFYVAAGHMNKHIAFNIGVSEITVKVHRGQVMRKMQARSLPELVRMADRLDPPAASPRAA